MMSDSEINEEKPKNEIKSDSSPPTPKDVENQKFDLKGEDNCLYTILIKKDEDSLFIQAFDKEKIERNDYKIKLSKDDFFKINKVFKQCDNIEEILGIIEFAQIDKRISIKKEKNTIIITLKLVSQIKSGFIESKIILPKVELKNEELFIRFFDKVNELNPFIKEMEKMKKELEETKQTNYEKYEKEINKINESLTNTQNILEELRKKDEELKNENDKKNNEVNNTINDLKKKDDELKADSDKKINDLNNIITELKKKDDELKADSDKKINDLNNIITELKKKDEEQQNIINELKKKDDELKADSDKKINDLNNTINDLKKKDDELKADSDKKINDLNNTITELKKKIEELEKKIAPPA